MNSSIQELKEATRKIQNITIVGTDGTNALGRFRRSAYNISETLSKSSPMLSQSWENVADTLLKVDNSFSDVLRELITDLYYFIDNSEKNEQMMVEVLEKTISLSQNILSKLSITE